MADDATLPERANADDAIADLLAGEDDAQQEIPESTSETEEGAEKKEEESNDDTEDLEEEQSEESTDDDESSEEESDQTWAGALGVDDANILLNETGDFAGVNVKVDGEQSTVDMKSLISGYQTNKHNTNKSKSLAAERVEFESIRDSAVQSYTKKLNDVTKLAEYMHKNLVGEYENVDWNGLRQNDPAEYAAMMQDFNKRNTDIQEVYSAISGETNVESKESLKNNQAKLQEHNIREIKKVQSNNPEWDTTDKLTSAFKEMGTFTNETYGLSPDVFNQLNDSIYVEIIKDAMAYRKGKTNIQKKIKSANLPKYQKSSKSAISTKKKVSKLDKLTKAAQNASGSNKKRLEVDAIAALIGG
jgi:hypothetical protein